MSTSVARASRDWLALREPVDAQSRSTTLVDHVTSLLPTTGPLSVHDLGSGTGSMRRWLAPQLRSPQTWIEYDRDLDLLHRADEVEPTRSRDGVPVTVETRAIELASLSGLDDASLITASALLDVLTEDALRSLIRLVAQARVPCLLTLSVIGHVVLEPAHPLDARVQGAFNDHQRRRTAIGRLLGPDAVDRAVALFRESGMAVRTEPSPWVLEAFSPEVLSTWLDEWLEAALEQDSGMRDHAVTYLADRRRQQDDGVLRALIHHRDLLAWPT